MELSVQVDVPDAYPCKNTPPTPCDHWMEGCFDLRAGLDSSRREQSHFKLFKSKGKFVSVSR